MSNVLLVRWSCLNDIHCFIMAFHYSLFPYSRLGQVRLSVSHLLQQGWNTSDFIDTNSIFDSAYETNFLSFDIMACQ